MEFYKGGLENWVEWTVGGRNLGRGGEFPLKNRM